MLNPKFVTSVDTDFFYWWKLIIMKKAPNINIILIQCFDIQNIDTGLRIPNKFSN